MKVAVRALVIGTVAVAVLAYVVAAGVAVAADSVGTTFRAALGPVLLVAVERDGAASVTTLGPGLTVIALAGGLANLVAALVLEARSSTRP